MLINVTRCFQSNKQQLDGEYVYFVKYTRSSTSVDLRTKVETTTVSDEKWLLSKVFVPTGEQDVECVKDVDLFYIKGVKAHA